MEIHPYLSSYVETARSRCIWASSVISPIFSRNSFSNFLYCFRKIRKSIMLSRISLFSCCREHILFSIWNVLAFKLRKNYGGKGLENLWRQGNKENAFVSLATVPCCVRFSIVTILLF